MKHTQILSIALAALLLLSACSGAKDYEAQFQDSVFVGDSLTEGISFNEYLPEEQVVAGAGATAGFSIEDLDKVVEQEPDRVYILLGQCDMLWPQGDPKALFEENYAAYLDALTERLPDCKLYLQSIPHVSKEALETEPRYGQIDEYNQVIAELAEEYGAVYVDLNSVVDAHQDLYAEDGVHFQKEFYPLWLDLLAETE